MDNRWIAYGKQAETKENIWKLTGKQMEHRWKPTENQRKTTEIKWNTDGKPIENRGKAYGKLMENR